MVKETIWFRVTCWSKLAEFANTYLKKGTKVIVEGRLVPDPNTGGPRVFQRSDGTNGASFEINAATIRSVGSRSDASETSGNDFDESDAGEDDIPF